MSKKTIPSIILAIFLGGSMSAVIGSTTMKTIENNTIDTITSGIDINNIDRSIRPQDSFYSYMNGKWLKKVKIPADRSAWGTFYELRENTLNQLYKIINELDKKKTQTINEQQLSDMYASYMNELQLNKLGIEPLGSEFAKIDAMQNKEQIAAVIAYFNKIGVNAPYDIAIHQDAKDSVKMIVDIGQSGLGLPDRDYYLETKDKGIKNIKAKYQTYVRNMLQLSGDEDAFTNATDIVNLETELAKVQWTKVENRDPIKTYNNVQLTGLKKLMPDYDWKRYFVDSDLNNRITYVIISQPSYLEQLNKIIQQTPLSVWKSYFKWQLLNSSASLLSTKYANKKFAFYGTELHGIPKIEPRWKRGIVFVEGGLGFSLGELYVKNYFPEKNKAKMQAIVANLITEYNQSIDALDWMGKDTKLEAKKKLTTMMLKIGYPEKWRDYSSLTIKRDDLFGNAIRASIFEYNRNINKLGKPVDRSEWEMTPQTVNAYYNPELNEIVFPAAILQAPFFNANADDAVNYGGIGAVIGHEISHAFDDQGSQYDEKGNLRNWWTDDDHKKFKAKTSQLVHQYSAYSPVSGYHVNGELTLGENIADDSGLSIAYRAYHLSLMGDAAPLMNGMTGDQRFYGGWAQVWRTKMRKQQELVYLKTDPHSPAIFRCDGALSNQDGFYEAFDVKIGDKMYLSPSNRVKIW
jgi:predicted metalloendopeptidase